MSAEDQHLDRFPPLYRPGVWQTPGVAGFETWPKILRHSSHQGMGSMSPCSEPGWAFVTAFMSRMKRSLQRVVIKGQTASTQLSWGPHTGRLQVQLSLGTPTWRGPGEKEEEEERRRGCCQGAPASSSQPRCQTLSEAALEMTPAPWPSDCHCMRYPSDHCLAAPSQP